jgi:hypothetical protein
MPEFESKYLNNYLNGITYENLFWKGRYNDLWNRFLYLQSENNRLQNLLNECYLDNTNTKNTKNTNNYDCSDNITDNDNTTNTRNTRNTENTEIISHLQHKNNELLKTVMDKSKEIFMLQGELEKHRQLKN